MEALENKLGYNFNDRKLLFRALTHSSVTGDLSANYERLEFLGDRVLGVAVAAMLCRLFPSEPEGNLSQRFMALVCKETVSEVALDLGLDKYIRAEGIDVKNNDNVLCDVGEAIIGAIYTDSGCMQAIEFVEKHWGALINTHTNPPKDAKTSLQEYAHSKGWNTPKYTEVGREGTEHNPIFSMKVVVNGQDEQIGKGHNKKLAEQDAAQKMLKALGVKNGTKR